MSAGEFSTGFGAALLQMMLALLAVSALAVLSLWALRRRLPATSGPLRVRARLPLDGRHTLYVVDAAGRQLLLGAGDGAIAVLAELDAEKLDEAEAATGRIAEDATLAAALKKALGGRALGGR